MAQPAPNLTRRQQSSTSIEPHHLLECHLLDSLENLWHFGRFVEHAGSPDDTITVAASDQAQATSTTALESSVSGRPLYFSSTHNSQTMQQLQLDVEGDRLAGARSCAGGRRPASKPHDVAQYDQQHDDESIGESTEHPLHPLFRLLDEDEDGRVSLDEMQSLLRKLGKEQVSSASLLSMIDTRAGHHSSSTPFAVDFPQFAALYESLFGEPQEETEEEDAELLEAFQVYDTNRDGFISASELAAVLLALGLLTEEEEEGHVRRCQALIDRVDSDGNGLVDLHEFKAMLLNPNTATTSGRSCGSSTSAQTGHHQSSLIACTVY